MITKNDIDASVIFHRHEIRDFYNHGWLAAC